MKLLKDRAEAIYGVDRDPWDRSPPKNILAAVAARHLKYLNAEARYKASIRVDITLGFSI
jgi:hypothetical protein